MSLRSKKFVAKRIISVSAAGSLSDKINPGELVLISQYFDHTQVRRRYSFFDDGLAGFVLTAQPACSALASDIQGG